MGRARLAVAACVIAVAAVPASASARDFASTALNIIPSGQYGGLRNFWMVTRGPATGAAKKWIKWIQKSKAANRIIATEWVPIH